MVGSRGPILCACDRSADTVVEASCRAAENPDAGPKLCPNTDAQVEVQGSTRNTALKRDKADVRVGRVDSGFSTTLGHCLCKKGCSMSSLLVWVPVA